MTQHRSELKLPADYERKIAETFNWKLSIVEEMLDFTEDKDGYFWATLKHNKRFDKPDFVTMCRLTRDLGGEDFLKGARAWKVPGPMAKKGTTGPQEKPSGHGIDSQATYKESGNAIPTTTSGLTQEQEAEMEGWPPAKLGYTEKFPITLILSPQFTFRMHIDDDIVELVGQIAGTTANSEPCIIAEPLVCRRASKQGYVEVGAGERRLLAARKMGLGVVPVIVKVFSDAEFDRIRLMENLARKDLTDYETARALKHLMDTYPNIYPTQANLADVFGKSREWVTQRLQMLKPELETIVTRVTLERGEVTEHQAREILAAPEEKREEIVDKINETGKVPSVREIHEITHPEEKAPIPEAHVCPFEEEHAPEPEVTQGPEMKVHEGTSYDVADFTCPQCKQSFRIVHLPSGKHSFKPVRQQK